MSFTIHATRDPAQILNAVRIQRRDSDRILSEFDDRATLERSNVKLAAESAWAAYPAVSGLQPLTIKNRAHHIVATGDWPFLEARYRQIEEQLAATKGTRNARKSQALHLAAPDGKWFTITVPGGDVAWGRPGEKKATDVYGGGLRFAWHDGHLVLTGDTRSSAKRPHGQAFLAPATERIGRWDQLQDVPSRLTPDWIKALCQAACDLDMDSLVAFGKLTGICAVCGRTLTDKLSKERGIGPVCWEQVILEVAA
jgi:hypothetical protein